MFPGLNSYQRFVLIIAWFGWVFDVMEASFFGLTKKAMLTEMLGSSGYAKSGQGWEGWIQAAMLIGWALGGLIFGIVADRWGRSKTLILTVFLYCLFTGLTSLCQNPGQVFAARFLTGLGIGGEWAAGAALIAETMPDNFRARAAAYLQTAAALGSIIGVLISIRVGELNWRLVYVAGIFPAVICLIARFRLKPDVPSEHERKSNVLVELVRTKPYNNFLLLAIFIGIVGITGGGLLPFWLPNFVKLYVPAAELPYWKNLSLILLHIGTFLGVLTFPPLTDRFGRRPMFALFGAVAGIMLLITTKATHNLTSLLIFAPITSFFALGLTAGFALYFTELFAHRFRATGSGVAYNIGRILSAPIAIFIGNRADAVGIGTAVAPFAFLYIILIVAIYFAPETRGKPLEA